MNEGRTGGRSAQMQASFPQRTVNKTLGAHFQPRTLPETASEPCRCIGERAGAARCGGVADGMIHERFCRAPASRRPVILFIAGTARHAVLPDGLFANVPLISSRPKGSFVDVEPSAVQFRNHRFHHEFLRPRGSCRKRMSVHETRSESRVGPKAHRNKAW